MPLLKQASFTSKKSETCRNCIEPNLITEKITAMLKEVK